MNSGVGGTFEVLKTDTDGNEMVPKRHKLPLFLQVATCITPPHLHTYLHVDTNYQQAMHDETDHINQLPCLPLTNQCMPVLLYYTHVYKLGKQYIRATKTLQEG